MREKVDSTIDRIFVAGVKSPAIIMGHFITNSGILPFIHNKIIIIYKLLFFSDFASSNSSYVTGCYIWI